MQGPDGKHLFGAVRIGEKGQIVIPKEARDLFGLTAGDSLMVAADENGIALFAQDSAIFRQLCSVLGGDNGNGDKD